MWLRGSWVFVQGLGGLVALIGLDAVYGTVPDLALISGAAALAAVVVYRLFVSPWRELRHEDWQDRPAQWVLTDDLLVIERVNPSGNPRLVRLEYDWTHMRGCRETRWAFLLYVGDGAPVILPKRSIGDAAHQAALRALVPRGR
jgi:hypothetical protein